jgi:hypothetical protein
MTNLMRSNQGLWKYRKLQSRDILGGDLNTGNIYYVVQTTAADYAQILADYQVAYSDGTYAVHTTIQSALDACTANRDDYVVVLPNSADYDITAALTMSKARVHLICPTGIGWNGIPGNVARIHQNTAALSNITVTADCVEIAGLFFKQYDSTGYDSPAVILATGTRWALHIHDCFFGMSASNAAKPCGIEATGACSHFSIHDNYFTNYGPGLMTGTDNTIDACIAITSTSSTRGVIRDNIIHSGANTTCDYGINCQAAYAIIENNIITQDAAVGSSQAGAITVGIHGVASSVCRGNAFFGGIGASAAFTGGTADASNVLNYDALNGGTLADQDT